MRPHIAPISDRSRELYGKYQPRYKTISSMRPFDAPISDRNRELFGEYQRRYETQPSMSAFDAPISDRRRELYGEYRARYSSQKIARASMGTGNPNGTNWVELTWSDMTDPLHVDIFDKSVYQYYAAPVGGWTGIPAIKFEIGGAKTYPYENEEWPTVNRWESLGFLSMNVRTGSDLKLWFKSSNAADGAGQTLWLKVGYATFE